MNLQIQRKLSLHYSNIDGLKDGEIIPILEGKLDKLPPLRAKVVRVFLSSTFSDMVHERNALMEKTYPRLKKYCQEKHRTEFQIIDLRWGLREKSQDDHTNIEFCIKEIENCKKLSIGPNFVALIGQKYGYRSFPSKIHADVFEKMRELLVNSEDIKLISTWFKKDTNIIPNKYILQPISSILENKAEFNTSIFPELLRILRTGIKLCFNKNIVTQEYMDLYFISVTHYEILKGMLKNSCKNYENEMIVEDLNNLDLHNGQEPRIKKNDIKKKKVSKSFCIKRDIINLENNVQIKYGKYLDLIPDTETIDEDAKDRLQILRNEVEKNLGIEEIKEFKLKLTDTNYPTEDQNYLESFCKQFELMMCSLIDLNMSELQHISRNQQANEILQHLNMCNIRSRIFRGRDDVMEKIRKYVLNTELKITRKPLVLFGLSGSGKTSVLAKSASLIPKWFADGTHGPTPAVIIRFLGTTSQSCSIRLVLANLCWHLSSLLNEDASQVPGDYTSLVNYFKSILEKVTLSMPVVLILDSIDQLSVAHRAHNLAWLPKQLPSNVYLILSTLCYEKDLLENLKVLFPEDENYIEISYLGCGLSISLIKEWLKSNHRNLTEDQMQIVEEALSLCSLPLYTKLVFEEICTWSSYKPINESLLENTVKGIINLLFEKIEQYHGKVFVKHSLSYLTASKNGLSDVELEDVLSLDDDVLDDVFEHWVPPIRRIPCLLIPRLHDALSNYLMEREADGTIVSYWYHRQFIFVAKERYLLKQKVDFKIYVHLMLSHYFLGTYGGGKLKPFKYTEQQQKLFSQKRKENNAADRLVPEQPLFFGIEREPEFRNSQLNQINPRMQTNYNFRKLSELPYHLIESKNKEDLKKEVLFNYPWIYCKLSAMRLPDVLSDFRTAIEAENNSQDVLLVFSALRVGGSYLNQNPRTLAFDLLGRLLVMYNENHISIRSLLQQCDELSLHHSRLLPIYQCFDAPRAMLLYTLEDHHEMVVDLIFTSNELISLSKDATIVFWDLTTGECTRNFSIEGEFKFGHNAKLYATSDNKYLVVDCDALYSPIYIYDLKTCQLLYKCGKRLATQLKGFLVGNILYRQKNLIDVSLGIQIKSIDDFLIQRSYLCCAITPNLKYILLGQDLFTKLFNFETNELLATFPTENMPSVMVISSDSNKAYIGYNMDCLFKVFNIQQDSSEANQTIFQFNYLDLQHLYRFPRGRPESNQISEISLSPINESVILLNIRRCILIIVYTMGTMRPVVLNSKSLNNETQYYGATFNHNGKLVLAGEERYIRVWDVETETLMNSISLHTTSQFPWAISNSQNLLATASTIHTAINIWDINKLQVKDAVCIPVYECPINKMTAAAESRLIFVKKSYSEKKGWKYFDCFGIDIWNVNTGRQEEFLPIDQYGKLLQMEIKADAQQLLMLMNQRNSYLVHYSMVKHGRKVSTIEQSGSKSFCVSYDWEYVCIICSDENYPNMALLKSLSSTNNILINHARCPSFSLDSQNLMYFDDFGVIVYSLSYMAPIVLVDLAGFYQTDIIIPLPVLHDHFLVSSKKTGDTGIWSFTGKKIIRLNGVYLGGIRDVSKDGRYAVDADLQVFKIDVLNNCDNIIPIIRFNDEFDSEDDIGAFEGSVTSFILPKVKYSFIEFTHDGCFLIWVEHSTVRVGEISTGKIIAETCTHEKVTSLVLLDHGYILVLGGDDGRIMIVKLMAKPNLPPHTRPNNASERAMFLLDIESLSPSSFIDLAFRLNNSRILGDKELPRAHENLKHLLVERAKKPHAFINTQQATSPPANISKPSPKHIRTSSTGGIQFLVNSTVPASFGPILKSGISPSSQNNTPPLTLTKNELDESVHNIQNSPKLMYQFTNRSRSMQDILSVSNNKNKSKEKSLENVYINNESLSGTFSTQKFKLSWIRDKFKKRKNPPLPPTFTNA